MRTLPSASVRLMALASIIFLSFIILFERWRLDTPRRGVVYADWLGFAECFDFQNVTPAKI
jgi:hypothetical protein